MNLFITWAIDPVFFQLGAIEIRYYGLCWFVALITGLFVLKSIFEKEGLSVDLLTSLFFYALFGSILGARLGHCLFYDPSYYFANPLEIFLPISKIEGEYYFTGYAGLASHGGSLGIMIALLIFSKVKKMNFWDLLDKLIVVIPLGGFFIRLGNFLNSEIVGIPTSKPWGVIFSQIDNTPRHAAQMYEGIVYLMIFFLMYYIYTRKRQNHQAGYIFGITAILIATSRIIIEYYKEVQEAFELQMRSTYGMDMGQLLSIPFIVLGIVCIVLKYKKKDVSI